MVEQTRRDQQRRQRTEDALVDAVPELVESVLATLGDQAWDERFNNWEQSWRWAAADSWLQKRTDDAYQHQLWQRRREAEQAIGTRLAEAAALRAWQHFFGRLSSKQSVALRSWREAVRAMGKGTGRSAKLMRLRKEARKYMDQCRDAIPVWIMPRYLVAEMIDMAPERYDVVIVDEASQLGIQSLFLFYIAKQMVVVGDDQQISPAGVGIADEAIASLQHHFLDGVPNQHALSAQSSLYGNAKIRFNQNIVLREHFRCMPEIIQFSNDLCYASNGTPLDPLRAYPADRLNPIVVRHIPDGYRIGTQQNVQNPPEADAIVAQIAACIDDPRYADRSMGVISLQGDAKAKLIEKKLLEKIQPEVIEERRLICGDANTFQGDERNVIFMSMVAAFDENRRIGVLSNEPARQRFNVAASRAQDQMWLFHSATLDVLSPYGMRHRLLSYMMDPGRAAADEEEQQSDSKFERNVCDLISEKGFHVRTQVSVGDPANHRYRIDLVVEGMRGRLAVECDGDNWHGPERYEQDMARQRDLERAGWQFVRIRESDFYRDSSVAMKSVWDELYRLGIEPGRIDAAIVEPPSPATAEEMARSEVDEIVEPAIGARSNVVRHAAPQASDPIVAATSNSDDVGAGDGQDLTHRQPDDSPMPSRHDSVESVSPGREYEPVAQTGLMSSPRTYFAFSGPAGPDPRTANLRDVTEGLIRIVTVEEPVLAKRAYDVYLRGCGIRRMGGEIRRIMNRALQAAISRKFILKEDELGKGGLIYSIVRTNGSAPVSARERGPCTFEEIPPSELQTAARLLLREYEFERGSDEHLRAVLEYFELKRLTVQVGAGILDALEMQFRYVDEIFDGVEIQ